jgi:hypothetical protein
MRRPNAPAELLDSVALALLLRHPAEFHLSHAADGGLLDKEPVLLVWLMWGRNTWGALRCAGCHSGRVADLCPSGCRQQHGKHRRDRQKPSHQILLSSML